MGHYRGAYCVTRRRASSPIFRSAPCCARRPGESDRERGRGIFLSLAFSLEGTAAPEHPKNKALSVYRLRNRRGRNDDDDGDNEHGRRSLRSNVCGDVSERERIKKDVNENREEPCPRLSCVARRLVGRILGIPLVVVAPCRAASWTMSIHISRRPCLVTARTRSGTRCRSTAS